MCENQKRVFSNKIEEIKVWMASKLKQTKNIRNIKVIYFEEKKTKS